MQQLERRFLASGTRILSSILDGLFGPVSLI